MQKDTILRFKKLCGAEERFSCSSALSKVNLGKELNDKDGTMEQTSTPMCSQIVPVGCPRILCKKDDGVYAACRMALFIESKQNESGYWMRLPCGTCVDKKDLHPITEEFVYEG